MLNNVAMVQVVMVQVAMVQVYTCIRLLFPDGATAMQALLYMGA